MSKTDISYVGYRPPTEKQLQFVRDLGLDISGAVTQSDVSRLITKEVRRRGRNVVRERNLKVHSIVDHPKYGTCEVVRVGVPTLKITLLVADTDCKIVVDAMSLAECPLA